MKNIKAVILAGGKGTRLYPITYEIPKPLLPVGRKPIINHLAELFFEYGINEIIVLASRDFKDEFVWWKKRYYPKKRIDIFAEEKPLGTFGGLWYLKDRLKGGDFFMTNGDELKKIDLRKMRNFHEKRQEIVTIALVKVPDPQNYGVVLTEKGKVKEFLEKPENPPTDYINSGLYLMSKEVFDYHPGPKFAMVEIDLFPRLAKQGNLAGFRFQGKWMDCGTFPRLEEAIHKWKQ